MRKICTVCKKELEFPDNFFRDKHTPSGYRCRCKNCDVASSGAKRANPEYKRAYRASHKKEITEESREKERERKRIYLAEMRKSPEYKARKAASDKRSRQRPKSIMARRIVKAVRKSERAIHKLSTQDWSDVCAIFSNRCAYCGSDGKLTLDHFFPLKQGGYTVLGNVVPACVHCNSSKQDKHPAIWCAPESYQRILTILEQH